jgi:hypothetical protein
MGYLEVCDGIVGGVRDRKRTVMNRELIVRGIGGS